MSGFLPPHRKADLTSGVSKASRRQRIFNIPPIIIMLLAVCCITYFIPAYCFSSGQLERFYAFFGFIPVLFRHNHDIFTQLSAVSYSFLHGNATHLGLNMLWFVIFGTPLANRLGGFFFFLFWLFTALIAALVYFGLNSDSQAMMIGASGAVSGMMGASARYNFQATGGVYLPETLLNIKQAFRSCSVLVALGSFIALNLLSAADQWQAGFAEEGTDIAWQAHLGGLLAGFFAVGFFDKWADKFKF